MGRKGGRRILWLIKGLEVGGAETLLVSMASHGDLDESFRYEAAHTMSRLHTLRSDLEEAGVPVHDLGARHSLDLRWMPRLVDLVRTRDYDVVHAHSPLVAGGARLALRTALRGARPALVTTEHSVWDNYRATTRFLNALTFRLEDAHVAVSEGVRGSFPERFASQLEVVVQGIPLSEMKHLRAQRDARRAELGLSDEEVVVATVANLKPEKDYPTLLEAAAQVLQRNPQVRFLAIGYGPEEQRLRARHARLGLGDRFRFLGYRDDAVSVTAACDVFALSSYQEGFPLAVMEALAVGVPTVATDVGGIPSAVTEGEVGFVVPPHRPDLLADRIERLVRDPELRARMSGTAREAAGRFDIRRTVAETERIYERVLARRRGRRSCRT